MSLIAKIRRLLQGQRAPALTAAQLCARHIDKEGAPESITAQAKARAQRHLDRGLTVSQTLNWVLPWLRVEKRRVVR